jgi:hypothetical protein
VSKTECKLVVVQAMATVMRGSSEAVPEEKVRDSVSQFIVGLVVRSQGNPNTMGAEGCNLVTSSNKC